jgi:hypothetical protein
LREPCLLGDAEPSLRRIDGLGFNRCDLFLITSAALRGTARVRVVSDFVTEMMQRHRDVLEG